MKSASLATAAGGMLRKPPSVVIPVNIVVVPVTLLSSRDGSTADDIEPDPDLALFRATALYPLTVGVTLLLESIVMDRVDIAELGRGLGLGLGGPPSESVVSAEEDTFSLIYVLGTSIEL